MGGDQLFSYCQIVEKVSLEVEWEGKAQIRSTLRSFKPRGNENMEMVNCCCL